VRLTDIPVGGRRLLNLLGAAAATAADKGKSATGSTENESRTADTTTTQTPDTSRSAGKPRKSSKVVEDPAAPKVSATQGAAESRGVSLGNYVASTSEKTRKELEAIGATKAATERKKVTISDLGLPDK
jgi:hypothetical protein